MKLVWSPENASKAYVKTVKLTSVKSQNYPGGEAEFLSAMAAGYNAKLIVEVRQSTANSVGCGGAPIAASVGLAVAAGYTLGRHVCMVPDEASRRDYVSAIQDVDAPVPEVVVGEAAEAVDALEGVDFLVVQGRPPQLSQEIFRRAKLSNRGAILVYKCLNSLSFLWDGVVNDSNKLRIVKSLSLPLENRLEIAYIAVNDGKTSLKSSKGKKRWIRHIDFESGEEHVFRR